MSSRGRLLFDLNELPAEDDEDNDRIICSQPQQATPSAISMASDTFATSVSPQDIENSFAFSHASSVSGFQPFVQLKTSQLQNNSVEQITEDDSSKAAAASSTTCENSKALQLVPGSADVQTTEREEGEWVGTEIFANQHANSSLDNIDTGSLEQGTSETGHASEGSKTTEKYKATIGSDQDPNVNLKKNTRENSEDSARVTVLTDCQEEHGLVVKRKVVKGVEASHAVKCANTSAKRKMDQQKEAMLGKKRKRQTMFLNLEDVKQAGSVRISTPRRQNFPQPIITRTVKEAHTAPTRFEHGGDVQPYPSNKDQKTFDVSFTGSIPAESRENKPESSAQLSPGLLGKPHILRQASWRQPIESSQHNSTHSFIRRSSLISQTSVDSMTKNKKLVPSKKEMTANTQYQDTSVEPYTGGDK